MSKASLKDSFIEFCEKKKFEQNINQIEIINSLNDFVKTQNFFLNFFSKSENKLCFYLHGDVGLGKTMISDFFYDYIDIPKCRLHFNEFMISFHDFKHKNKTKPQNTGRKTKTNKQRRRGAARCGASCAPRACSRRCASASRASRCARTTRTSSRATASSRRRRRGRWRRS